MAQVSTNVTGTVINEQPNNGQDSDAQAKRRQDRRKAMELIGLNPKDLKGLSPEDRRAKIKAAADPKIAALQEKKAAGTITADEQADLTLLQKLVHPGHKPKSDT
jgi:hypothetical protein